jgi:hypothetical protein
VLYQVGIKGKGMTNIWLDRLKGMAHHEQRLIDQ